MHPILLEFEFLEQTVRIHAYAVALVTAIMVIALSGWSIAVRRNVPKWPALMHSLAVAAALPIGSRILYWAMKTEWDCSWPDLLTRLSFRGFYLSGGLAAALVASMVVCRFLRLDFWRMADAMAPALGLGGAILRLGCFLNGCCFGRPSSPAWGVTYPAGSPAHLHQVADRFDLLFTNPLPVHPTQLYEMAASLVAAAIALLLHRRGCRDGIPILAALIWFLAFRWLNSYLRADGAWEIGPPWLQPTVYAVGLLLCVAILLRRCGVKATRAHKG